MALRKQESPEQSTSTTIEQKVERIIIPRDNTFDEHKRNTRQVWLREFEHAFEVRPLLGANDKTYFQDINNFTNQIANELKEPWVGQYVGGAMLHAHRWGSWAGGIFNKTPAPVSLYKVFADAAINADFYEKFELAFKYVAEVNKKLNLEDHEKINASLQPGFGRHIRGRAPRYKLNKRPDYTEVYFLDQKTFDWMTTK